MARNVALQILRGILSNIPQPLNDGEFYLATDVNQIYVGLGGINFSLRSAIMAAVEVNGNANPTHYIEPNSDGSVVVEGPSGAALAQDGIDATGVTPLAGATGIRGWLSSLYRSQQYFDFEPKGTQGATFLSIQQPKDSGRSKVILTLTKTAAITTEALVSLTQKKGDATTTTGTSYTVTAGKILRIQTMQLYITNITAAVEPIACAVRLREGAASGGVVSVASDIIAQLETGIEVATATLNAPGMPSTISFPDGVEITGGQQIGVSELSTSIDAAVTVVVTGYEY